MSRLTDLTWSPATTIIDLSESARLHREPVKHAIDLSGFDSIVEPKSYPNGALDLRSMDEESVTFFEALPGYAFGTGSLQTSTAEHNDTAPVAPTKPSHGLWNVLLVLGGVLAFATLAGLVASETALLPTPVITPDTMTSAPSALPSGQLPETGAMAGEAGKSVSPAPSALSSPCVVSGVIALPTCLPER